MLWRFSGSVLCGSVGVGGWVASLVLALVGCGRSYLPVLGSVSGWVGAAGVGCSLVVVACSGNFTALCRAALQRVGFRSARQALRFWGFRGLRLCCVLRLGSGGFGGGGVQKNLTRGCCACRGFRFGSGLSRWFWCFRFSNRQVKFSFSRRFGACQARFLPFFPGSPSVFRLRWSKKGCFFGFFSKKVCFFAKKLRFCVFFT